ncbi:MAG: phosphotransferase, partial [Gammaproteobacteria bacterium]
ERRRILRARGAIRATLLDYGKEPTTFSLIHADLHPHNVMVDGERLYVIDFDDAGFGWHQYELAVALFYYKGEKNFDVMRAALIAGYRSERDLTDTALELLPMFLLIRALVLLGWIHGRPELDRTDVLRRLIRRACSEIEELGL